MEALSYTSMRATLGQGQGQLLLSTISIRITYIQLNKFNENLIRYLFLLYCVPILWLN